MYFVFSPSFQGDKMYWHDLRMKGKVLMKVQPNEASLK